MDTSALLERIDERLKAVGLTERAACLKAGLKVDSIRTIRRGHAPRRETLRALAKVLQCKLSYLEAVAPDLRLNARQDDEREQLAQLYDGVPAERRRDFIAGARMIARLISGSETEAPQTAKGGRRSFG